jgi:uncharacterized protein (DUF433 family)
MNSAFYHMPRKRLVRTAGDVREFPRYSISEAAFYIRIPHSTLLAWTVGQNYTTRDGKHHAFMPLLELADPQNKLLSFYNLVEAHVLRAMNEKGVPTKNLRKALEYIRETIPSPHPLLTHDFEVSGKDAFIKHLGLTICATKYGQLAMRKVLEQHLERIERDKFGLPVKVFPINSRRLAIDPMFSSGKPIVKDKGIIASALWGRSRSGESDRRIADDYGLTEIEVKEAVEDYEWKAAA